MLRTRIVPCGSVLGGPSQNGPVAQAHCGYDSFWGIVSRISFMTLFDRVIWRKK